MENTTTTYVNTLIITGVYKFASGHTIKDIEFSLEIFSGSKFENLSFENVTFINCDFQATQFNTSKFIDCTFINCTFNFVCFNGCNFIACKIENCQFCITNSLTCNFLSCTHISNKWEASQTKGNFHNCHIDESEKSLMNITATYENSPLLMHSELCVA